MLRSKVLANQVSGILGFVAPTYFAWTVYRDGIPQNAATWGMTVFLDVIGLMLVYSGGNKRPFMQLGWVFAASCILAATLFGKSPWHWGTVETVSLILCLVAVVLWQTFSAQVGIFPFVIAMWLSAVPLGVDYWNIPQPSTLWLWVVSAGTCLLSIYGSEKQDVAHTAVPWGAIVLNSVFVFLCVR